jgi:phosphate starvation-inducible protein PhoH
MNDIGVFEFNQDDIVRNPLITQILKKYEKWDWQLTLMVF